MRLIDKLIEFKTKVITPCIFTAKAIHSYRYIDRANISNDACLHFFQHGKKFLLYFELYKEGQLPPRTFSFAHIRAHILQERKKS